MNELMIFNNPEFGEIRTVEVNGEPWFVAADVCQALEISRTQVRRLDDDEKGVCSTHTLGGEQEMTTVNEPGLYSLILGSRKKEAKAFKRWITHEVIPSIRRNGGYIHGQNQMNPEELMAQALIVAQRTIENQKAQLSAARVDLEIARPKAEYFDELVDRNLLTGFRETAKQLKVPPRRFVSFLLDRKYIYRDITNEGVIKMANMPSVQPELLNGVAGFVSSDIASVRINGSIVIEDITKEVNGNTLTVSYGLTQSQVTEVTKIELLDAAGNALTSSTIYVAVANDGVQLKHTIPVKEGN